ncbi:hypothetical protein AJ80_04139 [Polytolypa hystricis UAMH7299]|uniref:Pheromone-regulated membrane protein 6 n=1 Tax=Polytolypa hystricis (strain UAMH7299) TaxID=1447883 RepID=A0A2B7YEG5_POLH7|nr:hypothetical protein AJ80_04139 [Polytolypa hystricis UAMH7299]
MGCCGDRENYNDNVRAEQKWDYINLKDFKSTSCFEPFSYGILWISIVISFAVYGVDTFTAVNLLAFSRWSSEIKPKIRFDISKWIFAGCIILSFVLLIYRWLRALRAIRSGGIAQSYLDPLAIRVQSCRVGKKGQGWRRFLLFAALTKSKKGADYVAFFTYYNFEAWLRVVFAEGPRQAINGITLYSVMEANLIPKGENTAPEGTSSVSQFFLNIKTLADKDMRQAVILSAMLFTLVIWVVSFISFLLSVILYLLFLFHHIPSEDGSLTVYCRRKINTRLERIVKQRVDKALVKGFALQDRKNPDPEIGRMGTLKHQPTLPSLDQYDSSKGPDMPGLSRAPTQATLPPYRPPTAQQHQPTLPDLNWADDNTTMVGSSQHSRLSDDTARLVDNAGEFGYSPPGPYQLDNAPVLPPVERYGTPLSLMTGPRPPTSQGHRTPGPTPTSSMGRRTPGSEFQSPADEYPMPVPPPTSQGHRTPGPTPTSSMGRRTPGSEFQSPAGEYPMPVPPPSAAARRTPGPPQPGRTMTPGNGYTTLRSPPGGDGYSPFPAGNRQRTPGPPPSNTPGPNSVRNFARPTPPPNEFNGQQQFDRSYTPSQTPSNQHSQNQTPYGHF